MLSPIKVTVVMDQGLGRAASPLPLAPPWLRNAGYPKFRWPWPRDRRFGATSTETLSAGSVRLLVAEESLVAIFLPECIRDGLLHQGQVLVQLGNAAGPGQHTDHGGMTERELQRRGLYRDMVA